MLCSVWVVLIITFQRGAIRKQVGWKELEEMLLLGFSYWKKIILGPQEIKMKKEWAYEYKISLCCFILTMRGKRSRKKPHEHFHIEGKQRFGSVKVIKCFSFLKQNFLDISPCLITTTVWWHYIDLTKPLLSDILIVSFKKWVLSLKQFY